MSENHNQSFQRIFFFEKKKTAKSETLRSRHSHRLEIAKNYTIFKALGKKSGSRKQVHLWQISKDPSYNTIW